MAGNYSLMRNADHRQSICLVRAILVILVFSVVLGSLFLYLLLSSGYSDELPKISNIAG